MEDVVCLYGISLGLITVYIHPHLISLHPSQPQVVAAGPVADIHASTHIVEQIADIQLVGFSPLYPQPVRTGVPDIANIQFIPLSIFQKQTVPAGRIYGGIDLVAFASLHHSPVPPTAMDG